MSNKAQFEHRVASDKEKRRLGLLELAGKIEDRRNCVELGQFDVQNVLRNDAAADFGELIGMMTGIRISSDDEYIQQRALKAKAMLEDLFDNLNYSVSVKQ